MFRADLSAPWVRAHTPLLRSVLPHACQTTFPEARIRASITDLRLVLRWVAQNSERYGGDPRRIHLMGHGLSAHLAMLTLTQEAVVLSREGHLDRAYEREQMMVRWDQSEEDRVHGARNGDRQGAPLGLDGATVGDAWVDEPNDFTGHGLPPGAVMGATHRFDDAGRPGASIRAGAQLGHLENGNNAVRAGARGTQQGYGSTQTGAQTLEEAEAEIGNGLRRVEIYEPEVELPHIAGVILLAGVSDVIKGFRNESDRGVEHLSSLRRAMGPSHTSCLVSVCVYSCGRVRVCARRRTGRREGCSDPPCSAMLRCVLLHATASFSGTPPIRGKEYTRHFTTPT